MKRISSNSGSINTFSKSTAAKDFWLYAEKDNFKKDSSLVSVTDNNTTFKDFSLVPKFIHLDKYIALKSELKGMPIKDNLGLILSWADGTTDTIPNNNGIVHIVKDVASLDDTVQINKTDTTNYMWYMVALSNNKEKVEWLAQNAQYAQDGVIYGPSWTCTASTSNICKCRYY